LKKSFTGSRIAAGFNFVSTGVAMLGMAWLLWALNDDYNKQLEKNLGGTIEQSCVTARDRLPPRTPRGTDPVMTPKQQTMAALIVKMDETDIGRRLNESAARNGVLWCAGQSLENYGSYSGTANIAILNMPHFGGPEKMMADRVQFNRALRTMYEENAHAWQGNAQGTLIPPLLGKPHHKITWHVAVEGSARVTTFSALNQHRLAGDNAVWNDNISQDKNRHIMTRMDRAADASGAFGRAAHWAGMDAYYDYTGLVINYQHSAYKSPLTLFGRQDPANDSFFKMGTIPGVEGNYMAGNFDAYNPRYTYIRDPELRAQMIKFYNDNAIDSRPLSPAASALKTMRVSPR